MPSFEVEFEVYCGRCGSGLCRNSTGKNSRKGLGVDVDPCEKCLEKEHEDAYNKGYDEGYENANEENEKFQ